MPRTTQLCFGGAQPCVICARRHHQYCHKGARKCIPATLLVPGDECSHDAHPRKVDQQLHPTHPWAQQHTGLQPQPKDHQDTIQQPPFLNSHGIIPNHIGRGRVSICSNSNCAAPGITSLGTNGSIYIRTNPKINQALADLFAAGCGGYQPRIGKKTEE